MKKINLNKPIKFTSPKFETLKNISITGFISASILGFNNIFLFLSGDSNYDFGLIAILLIVFSLAFLGSRFYPPSRYLLLDAKGFATKGLRRHSKRWKWEEIEYFGTATSLGTLLVGFSFKQNYVLKNTFSIRRNRRFYKLDEFIPDVYSNDISSKELVNLMNSWLQESRVNKA